MKTINITSASTSALKGQGGRKKASSLSQSKLPTASLFGAVEDVADMPYDVREKARRDSIARSNAEFEAKVNAKCLAIRKAIEERNAIYQVLALDITGEEFNIEVEASDMVEAVNKAEAYFDTATIILSIFKMI